MSAQPAVKQSAANDSKTEKIIDKLHSRASQEFVIAVMGAVGSGLARIVTEFEAQLIVLGYKVVKIKMSAFIGEQIQSGHVAVPQSDQENRFLKYQTGGNLLRALHGHEIMSKYVINQIGRHRIAIDPKLAASDSSPPRIAYIIDQIKHPAEVALLRTVYRNNFYLVGVMSLEKNRRSRLVDDGMTRDIIDLIISRDRKEVDKSGQQLEKAFKLADYFLHNPLGDDRLVPEQVKRFLDLTHGDNGITPTSHEHAMYVAYSTAMKSSCLSRQVGAAITDSSRRVIAVGTNDVPRYRGGLYSSETEDDDRCFKERKICENSSEKNKRKDKIRLGIQQQFTERFTDPKMLAIANEGLEAMVELVFEQSGIPDLIEFSRAVHAEMDALISLTRGGGGSTVGANLYATTFPCHNCARHIIAAGIDKVYYIEPYEKSLAPEAHNDAIEVLDHDEAERPGVQHDRLRFVHFSGVGPRMYPKFFLREDGRKDDAGVFIPNATMGAGLPIKIIHEYLDSYRDFEIKVAGLFDSEFPQ
jgi:deoxycytidylate deaminase